MEEKNYDELRKYKKLSNPRSLSLMICIRKFFSIDLVAYGCHEGRYLGNNEVVLGEVPTRERER